jgi:hypothetical protein
MITNVNKKVRRFSLLTSISHFFAMFFITYLVSKIDADTTPAVVRFALFTLHIDVSCGGMKRCTRCSVFSITSSAVYW